MAENKKISDLHTIVQLHDDDEFIIVDKSTKTGADASGSGKTTKLKVWQLKQELVTSGEKGQKGSTGPEGPQGANGANGRDGRDGFDGQKGEPGVRGQDGVVGRDGIDGTDGVKGDKGQQGERGIDGNASDGVKGDPGPKGEPGAPGADGARGRDGVNGDDGAKGQKGNVGQQGSQGVPGASGKSGEKGAPGINGASGGKGQKGDQGVTGADLAHLPGTIVMTAASSAPSGWLLCRGQTLSKTTYKNLFNMIGTTYGGNSTNFNIPDLRGRVVAGHGSSIMTSSGDKLGQKKGSQTHTLTTAEMPKHSHPYVDTYYREAWSKVGSRGIGSSATDNDNYDYNYSRTTSNAGSGHSHNNLQPTIILNYMIKF